MHDASARFQVSRYLYSDEDLTRAVSDSLSVMEVLRRLGIKVTGGSHRHISHRIHGLGLDKSHFKPRTHYLKQYRTGDNKRHWSSILVYREGSDKRQAGKLLRRAMIESGVVYQCRGCGMGSVWNRQTLVLEVDHLNNDWTDDRKENLRFLCPNCHSQKPKPKSFKEERDRQGNTIRRTRHGNVIRRKPRVCVSCGGPRKSSRSKLCGACHSVRRQSQIRPGKDVLANLLWEKPTSVIAKEFGVTDTAVAKWAKAYDLSKPPRGYWAKIAASKTVS